jgi:hypothetical protein
MKRFLALLVISVACLSFTQPAFPWIPFFGDTTGTLDSSGDVDYWYIVYDPNMNVVVDSLGQFVPEVYLYDGDRSLIDSFIGTHGETVGQVQMPPMVGATNILVVEVTATRGHFPADYKIGKH